MSGEDSSTVSYIDLLPSALGASLLLMLILSIQARQQVIARQTADRDLA